MSLLSWWWADDDEALPSPVARPPELEEARANARAQADARLRQTRNRLLELEAELLHDHQEGRHDDQQ